MPELPEVETYVRELEPDLQGYRVTGAEVFWPRTIADPSPDDFVEMIVGERFQSFGRRGKYMLLGMESGNTLIVHLRMTGKLLVVPYQAPLDAHTHVVLTLDSGQDLHYHDTRKFGRIWLVPDPQPVLQKLGPEPLSDQFTDDGFAAALAARKASIKALLLDQAVVAGVGNIYADEALFAAGIDPRRRAGSLTEMEVGALRQSVREVLDRAIIARGSSLGGSNLQNYLRPGGEQGGFQAAHRVFRRTGEECFRCGTPIERVVLAQRSTHFCPRCQR